MLVAISSRQLFSTVRSSTATSSTLLSVANYGTSTPSVELPKRPPSAFLKFANEMRLELPKTTLTQGSKILAQKWKELPEEKKQKYVEIAEKEFGAWRSEKDAILTKLGNTKEFQEYLTEKKKKKAAERQMKKIEADRKQILNETEKPKRPTLPHSLYIKEKFRSMKEKNPDIPTPELFTSIMDEYRSLPEEKKAKYIKEYERIKAEYCDSMAKWNEKMAKSGILEDLKKANAKLKSVKEKSKGV